MSATQLQQIPITKLFVSKTKSQAARRKRFDKATLQELADSIERVGVLQNVIARKNGKGFELVAGERRLLAAKIARLKTIPGVVRDLTDEQVLEIQLVENLQRADLHPMEEAEGYQQLMKKHGHKIEDLHTKVGKSRSYVYGRIKLLALCDKARQAFYSDKISASIALLIARIPVEKLQREALDYITNWDSCRYRRAKEIVQQQFMLRLADATFPTGDVDLVASAGACRACPKRTGNQPELFGDVKGADVCTDPTCFSGKTKAHAKRRIAEAKANGQPVLLAKDAKKVAPYGATHGLRGYANLDEKNWDDRPKNRKNRSIVGKDVEITLLEDSKTGAVVELVKQSVVDKALRKPGSKATRQDDGTAAARRKQKLEREFRKALYEKIRPKLKTPTLKQMAHAIFDRLEHENQQLLCKLRNFEPPVKKLYGYKSKDYPALGKTIDKMSNAEIGRFINDCIYVRELNVHTWSNSKPEQLLAAAKKCRVSPTTVRRAVAAKSKKKKKTTKKAKKKAARKKKR